MTLGHLVAICFFVAIFVVHLVDGRDTKIRREHARKRHQERMGERE